MEEVADYCYKQILAQDKRPLFVGVTGDSGSGKSYLVILLEQRFKARSDSYTLINHDDFLISRQDREPMKNIYYQDGPFAGKSHWEILENMFRLDEFKRVISKLRAGKDAEYHPYSRASGTVSPDLRVIHRTDFMVFDTSMMLNEMDFVILVDVTQENIIKRKLVRDSDIRSSEAIKEMHKKVQGYYWVDRGKPIRADIIIDNNDFSHVKLIQT